MGIPSTAFVKFPRFPTQVKVKTTLQSIRSSQPSLTPQLKHRRAYRIESSCTTISSLQITPSQYTALDLHTNLPSFKTISLWLETMKTRNLLSILFALSIGSRSTMAQQWLPNGAVEWSNRCALGSEASGEYVCFQYSSDITKSATGGVYQGYANDGGTSQHHASLLPCLHQHGGASGSNKLC